LFGDELKTTNMDRANPIHYFKPISNPQPSGFKFYNVVPKFMNEKLHHQDTNK
jgi:hypothetical protein